MHFQCLWADEIFPMLSVWVSLPLLGPHSSKRIKKTYFLEERIHLTNFDLKQFSSAFFIWLVFHQKKPQQTKWVNQKRYIWLFLRGDWIHLVCSPQTTGIPWLIQWTIWFHSRSDHKAEVQVHNQERHTRTQTPTLHLGFASYKSWSDSTPQPKWTVIL